MTVSGEKELVSRKYSAVVSHVQLMRGQRRPNPGTSGREECTVLTTAKLSLFFKTKGSRFIFIEHLIYLRYYIFMEQPINMTAILT